MPARRGGHNEAKSTSSRDTYTDDSPIDMNLAANARQRAKHHVAAVTDPGCGVGIYMGPTASEARWDAGTQHSRHVPERKHREFLVAPKHAR